jgi:glucose/arabinose dehydrogenase
MVRWHVIGLLSLNTNGWYHQRSRVNDGDSRLGTPRGLVYAPDGTLFVVDEHVLFQFAVTH